LDDGSTTGKLLILARFFRPRLFEKKIPRGTILYSPLVCGKDMQARICFCGLGKVLESSFPALILVESHDTKLFHQKGVFFLNVDLGAAAPTHCMASRDRELN
jgi:hypothetical protein